MRRCSLWLFFVVKLEVRRRNLVEELFGVDDPLMSSVSFNDEAYSFFKFDSAFPNPSYIIPFEITVKFICCFFVNASQKLNRDERVRVDDPNDLAKTVVEPFTDVVCARL